MVDKDAVSGCMWVVLGVVIVIFIGFVLMSSMFGYGF